MDYKRLHNIAITELKQYKELTRSERPEQKHQADMMCAVLNSISERERYILEQFFINGEEGKKNGHRDVAMAKYGLSRTELYRLKDAALTNYCFSMLIAVMGGKPEINAFVLENSTK
jgi:DNA-directed RNA polymerase specialized sigma subunit